MSCPYCLEYKKQSERSEANAMEWAAKLGALNRKISLMQSELDQKTLQIADLIKDNSKLWGNNSVLKKQLK